MNNRHAIIQRLKEGDSAYQEFFRAALKKFGSKTPADMSDEEKDKFFTYVENNWNDEDPKTDDKDVVDEKMSEEIPDDCDGIPKGTGKKKGRKISEEERFRVAIRKEIVSALSEEILKESSIFFFFYTILGTMINVKLANPKAADKYASRLGPKWEVINIGEAINYLRELQEQASL